MRAKHASGSCLRRWARQRRRVYVRHRIKANAAMVALMLLGIATQETVAGWLIAGAPMGRGPVAGHLMVRPPEPDGRIDGTVRFEPHGPETAPAAGIASMLSRGRRPGTVEATTSHAGRWSIPADALRRGWTYRITAQAGGCPSTDAATINVPWFTRAQVPPLTAASCRAAGKRPAGAEPR